MLPFSDNFGLELRLLGYAISFYWGRPYAIINCRTYGPIFGSRSLPFSEVEMESIRALEVTTNDSPLQRSKNLEPLHTHLFMQYISDVMVICNCNQSIHTIRTIYSPHALPRAISQSSISFVTVSQPHPICMTLIDAIPICGRAYQLIPYQNAFFQIGFPQDEKAYCTICLWVIISYATITSRKRIIACELHMRNGQVWTFDNKFVTSILHHARTSQN